MRGSPSPAQLLIAPQTHLRDKQRVCVLEHKNNDNLHKKCEICMSKAQHKDGQLAKNVDLLLDLHQTIHFFMI